MSDLLAYVPQAEIEKLAYLFSIRRNACGCESCQHLGPEADWIVATNYLTTLQQGELELPSDPEEWRNGL